MSEPDAVQCTLIDGGPLLHCLGMNPPARVPGFQPWLPGALLPLYQPHDRNLRVVGVGSWRGHAALRGAAMVSSPLQLTVESLSFQHAVAATDVLDDVDCAVSKPYPTSGNEHGRRERRRTGQQQSQSSHRPGPPETGESYEDRPGLRACSIASSSNDHLRLSGGSPHAREAPRVGGDASCGSPCLSDGS